MRLVGTKPGKFVVVAVIIWMSFDRFEYKHEIFCSRFSGFLFVLCFRRGGGGGGGVCTFFWWSQITLCDFGFDC